MNRFCVKLKTLIWLKICFLENAEHLIANPEYTQPFVEHVFYIIFEHNKLI